MVGAEVRQARPPALKAGAFEKPHTGFHISNPMKRKLALKLEPVFFLSKLELGAHYHMDKAGFFRLPVGAGQA